MMGKNNHLSNEEKEVKKLVECRLVSARLDRYLTGEKMPESLLNEVERHLFLCFPCQKNLKERKITLQSMLQVQQDFFVQKGSEIDISEKLSKKALLLTFLKEKQGLFDKRNLLIDKIYEKPEKAPGILEPPKVVTPSRSQSTPKPLHWRYLSFACLVVTGLIIINHVGADPTKIFGQKIGSITEIDELKASVSTVQEPLISDDLKDELLQSIYSKEISLHKAPIDAVQWLKSFDIAPVAPEKSSIILDFAIECMKNEVFTSAILPQSESLNEISSDIIKSSKELVKNDLSKVGKVVVPVIVPPAKTAKKLLEKTPEVVPQKKMPIQSNKKTIVRNKRKLRKEKIYKPYRLIKLLGTILECVRFVP